jgi:GntR family transcriptional regulator
MSAVSGARAARLRRSSPPTIGSAAPGTPIPLYFQIVNVLEARIYSGRYPPGSLLGTEKELALEFGVSRITVQRALDALTREGLVERQRARGTFVSPSLRPARRVELYGFLDDVMVMGGMGETRAVEMDELAATERVATALGLRPGTHVTRVRRLRMNQGKLNTFVVDYLPLDVGRLIAAGDLRSDSMIHLIDQLPGLRLERGHQLLSARAASGEVADKLAVPAGTPILLVERDVQTATGRTVNYARFHYLGHPQSVRVSRVGR